MASEWFREHGFVAEAVQHAISSGQATTVARLFEKLGGWRYALQGHVVVLERALSLLGDTELVDYPRLSLGKIFLSIRRGEIDRAQSMLDALESARADSSPADTQFNGELQLVRTMLSVYADTDISDAEIRRVEQLSESLPLDDDLMHAARLNLLCALYAQRGSFEASVAAGDKAIRHYRAMGSVWGETFIYFHEGYACMAEGRLRDAEACTAPDTNFRWSISAPTAT
jgi:LuxR family maltose regulon positive regulatory protein